jgi:hypothetical protein
MLTVSQLRLALNNVSETITLARYHQRHGPALLNRKDFLEITSCGTSLAGIIIGELVAVP